jgi:hypothetical protein
MPPADDLRAAYEALVAWERALVQKGFAAKAAYTNASSQDVSASQLATGRLAVAFIEARGGA